MKKTSRRTETCRSASTVADRAQRFLERFLHHLTFRHTRSMPDVFYLKQSENRMYRLGQSISIPTLPPSTSLEATEGDAGVWTYMRQSRYIMDLGISTFGKLKMNSK